ncbi:MAG: hypothetical protein M1829_004444 [Trizodia sp. TS-e1964]|nr:MAG: hypothetical protein M1829_004444 [Trizodia sp. TS-e1964]
MADVTKPRPEKPDEEQFKADLAIAEKGLADVQEKMNIVRAKLDKTKAPNKESPAAIRQQELRNQLSEIKNRQSGLKSSKGNTLEKIRALDATLKYRITEQKTAKGRIPFKNVDEVDREIKRLEKQVDTGTMKPTDENKALLGISGLRKQRKSFAGFEESEKGINAIRDQIADLKKELEDPESKKLSERYNVIAKELDGIKAEQDSAYKGLSSLREERQKLYDESQEKYAALRLLKDNYFKQKKAYAEYEHEAKRARIERQKAERDQFEKEKRRKIAESKLEEASEPVYVDEILTAEGLIRYFDPSSAVSTAGPLLSSKFAPLTSRTIEGTDLKGTRVMKKEEKEEDYFKGTGGKKGKKGKKNGANSANTQTDSGKFNLSMGVLGELSKIKVEAPMSQADVPAVVEKLKEKLAGWKKNQSIETEKNIAKAQKEIDRLEAQAHEVSNTSSNPRHRGQKGSAKKASGSVLTSKDEVEEKESTLGESFVDVAKELEQSPVEEKPIPTSLAASDDAGKQAKEEEVKEEVKEEKEEEEEEEAKKEQEVEEEKEEE